MPLQPSTSTSTPVNSSRRGALGLLAVLICATAIGAVNLAALQMPLLAWAATPRPPWSSGYFLGNALGLVAQG